MFNTNDIVRWRDDGSLETFGRGDDQVKIKVSYSIAVFTHILTWPGIPSRVGRCLSNH